MYHPCCLKYKGESGNLYNIFNCEPLCICTGPYLIVATNNSLVGSIDGHAVYSITDFDVIPFSKSTIHLSDVQVSLCTCTCINTYAYVIVARP